MAGRTDPPDGTPGGAPGGGDEEYQSTVFDESFVRAARLQEYSAQERLEEHTTAVRRRPPRPEPGDRTLPKQAIALALIILLAFAAAIYLGSSNPYGSGAAPPAGPPASTVVPLAPRDEVPGADRAAALYARSPAEEFGVGAGGVDLPDPLPTAHFSSAEVLTALTLAKEYVVASALNADVLKGATSVPVRELLDPAQQEQLAAALAGQDPRTAATSWLVRFDPDEVALAEPLARVDGSFSVVETGDGTLEVTGSHVFAYAVRPAGEPDARVSLFTVRRDVRLQFGEAELRNRQVVVRQTDTLAGPMDCAADPAGALHPMLAGERPSRTGAAGTDPYALATPADAAMATGLVGPRPAPVCGTLAPEAQPSPAGGGR